METKTVAEPTTYANTKLALFKTLLIEFASDKFDACSSFKNYLEDCKTEDDIKRLLKKYKHDIGEKLGIENFEDEVDDLEDTIRRLENENSELEDKVYDTEYIFGNTLDATFKMEFIREHANKYTCWELEELLINGKELLKK